MIVTFNLINVDRLKRVYIDTVRIRIQINSDSIVRQNMVEEVAVGGFACDALFECKC
jgi:hypothetical protein